MQNYNNDDNSNNKQINWYSGLVPIFLLKGPFIRVYFNCPEHFYLQK